MRFRILGTRQAEGDEGLAVLGVSKQPALLADLQLLVESSGMDEARTALAHWLREVGG